MSVIQINQKISGESKIVVKAKASRFNSEKNWKTVTNVTVTQLAEYIGKGYSVRGGVKVNGNSLDSVESVQWLFLDFDHSTLQQSLQSPMTKYAALWYYTLSYEPGKNEKHRLVFKLDRSITTTEYKNLATSLIEGFYPSADKLVDAGRLFFGTSSPEYVHILDESITLPVDNILSATGSILSITPSIYDNASTFTGNGKAALPNDKADEEQIKPRLEALKHIAKHIWLNKCSGEDIEALYCLDKHNFQKQPKGQNLAKWHGHRPDDTEKDTGTGFLVIWNDEELPPTWQNQATGEKGNFIDYWHKYKNLILDPSKRWESLENDYLNSYKVTKAVINDICKSFGIEKFDLSKFIKLAKEQKKKAKTKAKNDFNSLIAYYLDNYVNLIKGDGKDGYLVYDFKDGIWRVKISPQQVWQYVVKTKINEDYPGEFDLENSELVSDSINYILNYINYQSVENLIGMSKKSLEHCIPLKNGHYDNKKQKFIPNYEPNLFNFHRFGYEYKEAGLTRNVEKFLSYFSTQYPENVKQMLIDWMVINIHGIAYKSRCMVNIYGTPETGKTVLGNLLINILGDDVSVATTGSKFSKADKFMGQRITQGTKVLFIDEFDNPNHEMWQRLKEMTGSSEMRIEVEQKYSKSTSILVKLGITTVSQDNLTLTNWDDGGIRRRLIPVRHVLEMYKQELQEIDEFFSDTTVCSEIFSYLLHINPYEALKRVREYAKSEYNKEEKLKLVSGNDKVLMFMRERLEFTDDVGDFVSNQQLTTEFTKWLALELNCDMNDNFNKRLIANLTANIRTKSRIPDNKIKWNLCPEQGETVTCSIGGAKTRGLRGIKIKEYDRTVEDELHNF